MKYIFRVGDRVKVKGSPIEEDGDRGYCNLIGDEATIDQLKGGMYILRAVSDGISHHPCGAFEAKSLELIEAVGEQKPVENPLDVEYY